MRVRNATASLRMVAVGKTWQKRQRCLENEASPGFSPASILFLWRRGWVISSCRQETSGVSVSAYWRPSVKLGKWSECLSRWWQYIDKLSLHVSIEAFLSKPPLSTPARGSPWPRALETDHLIYSSFFFCRWRSTTWEHPSKRPVRAHLNVHYQMWTGFLIFSCDSALQVVVRAAGNEPFLATTCCGVFGFSRF